MTIVRAIALAAALVLAGCSLPRGAAIEREVVGSAASETQAQRDFGVAPVTRALLPVYAAWPDPGAESYPWIERVDQPDTRILAPGDTVTVTIWSTEENGLLTSAGQRAANLGEMRVSSSGTIFLPYVGTIPIAGMAPETARARIEELYTAVSPSAQVQLGFVEGRQNTVSLVGGVAVPGSYPLPDRDFTVTNLIAEGGGVSGGLENPQIRLHRDGRIYGTSVERLLDTPRFDTTLVGGDRIFVEADERTFLALGASGTEAVYPFGQDSLTALEAMARIGGLDASRANPQGILILRRYPPAAVRPGSGGPSHDRMVFTLDLTTADGLFSAGEFEIRSGDLVYATESPVSSVRTVFALIGSSFGLAAQVGG